MMRLFKTRDKLSQPIRIDAGNQKSDQLPDREGINTPLPEAFQNRKNNNSISASGSAGGFREIGALHAAGAYAAPRAFTALNGGSVRTKQDSPLTTGETSDKKERTLKTPEPKADKIENKAPGKKNQDEQNKAIETKENETPDALKKEPEILTDPSVTNSETDPDNEGNSQSLNEVPVYKKQSPSIQPAGMPVTPHKSYRRNSFIVGRPP